MNDLTFENDRFYLDGEPFSIIAGDVHYFRIHPDRWERVLDLALDFGLNTIQTYVPWNAHEQTPGEFNFEGFLDLSRFLKLCQEKELKVLLRPSPYICSEWDLGGLPSWLLKDRDIVLRASEPKYLRAVKNYYEHLIPVFLPYLATNGGSVIAVAIENEYGSYGNDHAYLKALRDMLRCGGVNVPFYTTDGASIRYLTFGALDEPVFFGVNYRAMPATSASAKNASKSFREDNPFFIGELWSGRSMHWGEPFSHRPPEETAKAYKEALMLDGNVCFYMFAGGTNFGFMGGANIGRSFSPRSDTPVRYIPHTTSYDVDALVSESGKPTEKYFMCRDVLDEYWGRKKRAHIYTENKVQETTAKLSLYAELFDNLDALTESCYHSLIPKPMEDYDQAYGLILYSTQLDAFKSGYETLQPSKYKDRANFYINGNWTATFLRDRGVTATADGVKAYDGAAVISLDGEQKRIDVLVENIGRVNYGKDIIDERKGMSDAILCSGAKLFGYDTRTLPLKDLSKIKWCDIAPKTHAPCFFKGIFSAISGADTYVDFRAFGHGYIWINGFNLGRYDSAGPQLTLFVPGEILYDGYNEITILDINPKTSISEISLLENEILEGDSVELS